MKRLFLPALAVLCAGLPVTSHAASGPVPVITYLYGNSRAGWNPVETVLTYASVNTKSFGRLFSQPVDGNIYAQPLYVPNLTVNGAAHNIVFVATENNSVYAFDADSNAGANGSPLWQRNFNVAALGIGPVPSSDVNNNNIVPLIGITGTPVISLSQRAIYVVAAFRQVYNGSTAFFQQLHALDLATGAEKAGSPVLVQPAIPGTCGKTDGNGNVIFNGLRQNQRPGLLLLDGTVYVAWASHGDLDPYNGWVVGFDAKTLAVTGIFNDSPDAAGTCRAGIWQGGAAPAADAYGNIYFFTGNGAFNANTGGRSYGDSAVKLSTAAGLALADFFTPYNQASLNSSDTDLGSGGLILLPNQPGPYPHLMTGAGKQGTIYLLNRDNLGGFNPAGDTQVVQTIPGALGSMSGVPVNFGSTVFFGAGADYVKAFALSSGLYRTTPVSQTAYKFGGPGPGLSGSSTPTGQNAILWVLEPHQGYNPGPPAVLHAYAAGNLAKQLYNSNQNAARDNPGPGTNFSVPVVVNGKVYVGTANCLSVFGLL